MGPLVNLRDLTANVAVAAVLASLLTALSFTGWLFYQTCILWSRV